jgi:hypothetical protein
MTCVRRGDDYPRLFVSQLLPLIAFWTPPSHSGLPLLSRALPLLSRGARRKGSCPTEYSTVRTHSAWLALRPSLFTCTAVKSPGTPLALLSRLVG